MVAQLKRLFIGTGALLLFLSACGGPPPAPTVAAPNYPLTLTSIAQTSAAETASVLTAAPSATPVTLVTAVSPSTTGSPAVPIATLTATLAIPASPVVPMVSVTTGTNCRTGPGRVYDLVGGAEAGVRFTLIGKSTPTSYWIIQLPDGRACWLWGQYAVVEGNVNSLPEYPIPATPIPPVGTVAGLITNSGGGPLANVLVSAVRAGQTFITGTDGRYSFPNLPTGQEFIQVSASGFAGDSRSVNILKSSVVTADFVLFPAFQFTPTLPPATQVEGHVVMNGAPAAGAIVWIGNTSIRTIADNHGYYRLAVDPGNYAIVAQLGNTLGVVPVSAPANQMTTALDIVLVLK